jgi:hypothetical protein
VDRAVEAHAILGVDHSITNLQTVKGGEVCNSKPSKAKR